MASSNKNESSRCYLGRNSSSNSSDEEKVSLVVLPKIISKIHHIAASCDIESLNQILIIPEDASEEIIIGKIAEVLITDESRKNRTILHMAAAFLGDPSASCDCVKAIVNFAKQFANESIYQNFINALDNDGNTALYLAAKTENIASCKVLLYSDSDLDMKNKRSKTPIMKLFKKVPAVMADIFHECGNSSYYADSERRTVKLFFRTFISVPTKSDLENRRAGLYREMDLLANLSFSPIQKRAEILNDTHVKALVWLKWQHYKFIFWLARAFQITWFLLYFFFLLTTYRVHCPYPVGKAYNFSWIATSASSDHYNFSSHQKINFSERNCATTPIKVIGWILMWSAVLDALLIEGYPTVVRFNRKWHPIKTHSLKKYAKHMFLLYRMFHLDKITFLASIFLNTIPITFGIDLVTVEWQYVFASVGVFLSWFQIFLQFGKFPTFKSYIKMLTNTIYTLCLVGLLYFSLIVAFAMVFCILLPGVVTYASPFEAILRMSTFTIGEVDFEDTFYGDATPPASFIVTAIFFGIAIIILHIALLNFLIGLTINELQNVWEQAESWETYTYLWQVYLCETFISGFPISFCINYLYRRMILPSTYHDVSLLKQENAIKFYEAQLNSLPKNIRKEIRHLNLKFIEK